MMQPMAQAKGGTVLVVDDDPDVRKVLADAFESEGFRVMTAANGMQALHRARDAAPDVIILDLNMPMMSGDAFLYAWRVGAETHSVPVVAISAAYPSLQPEDLGVDAFFPKPFEMDLLVRHVKDLLAYRPRSSEAGPENRETEVNATLRDLSKVMSAIVGGVEALANDPSIPPKLQVVATSTLGSTQRAGILVRRLQHLAASERRRR
ncbi:MAG TPA: response regulator [Chloroflexota bacterium]|nr:response regulator [Chloroflexota bacterium]